MVRSPSVGGRGGCYGVPGLLMKTPKNSAKGRASTGTATKKSSALQSEELSKGSGGVVAKAATKMDHVVANVATKRRVNWDEAPVPTKWERARMEHIHAALRRAQGRGNVVLPN